MKSFRITITAIDGYYSTDVMKFSDYDNAKNWAISFIENFEEGHYSINEIEEEEL